MSTTGDVKADIRKLVDSFAAHKGWFICDKFTLSRQLDALLKLGRPTSEESLALARSRYEKLRVHDAGHVRLTDWLQQFRRYYHASHFDDGNDDQKHGWIFLRVHRSRVARVHTAAGRP
jgi:hypothetical protein